MLSLLQNAISNSKEKQNVHQNHGRNKQLNKNKEQVYYVTLPVLSVPWTSGQAWKLNNKRLSSVQLSMFETGLLHSPWPRLYVNVNGPIELWLKNK